MFLLCLGADASLGFNQVDLKFKRWPEGQIISDKSSDAGLQYTLAPESPDRITVASYANT